MGGCDQRFDPVQHTLVSLDVDAGRGVRQSLRAHHPTSCGDGGSGTCPGLTGSSNCILSISSCCGTATGYEPSKQARQNSCEVPRPMARISPGMDRYSRLSAPMRGRTSSTVRPDATSSLV